MGNNLICGESANANQSDNKSNSVGVNCCDNANHTINQQTIEAIDYLVNTILCEALKQIHINMNRELNNGNTSSESIGDMTITEQNCEPIPLSSPISDKISEILHDNSATPDHINMSTQLGITAYYSASSSTSSSPLFFYSGDETKIYNVVNVDDSDMIIEDNYDDCDDTSSLGIPYKANTSARESPSLLYTPINPLKFRRDSPTNSSGTSNSSCVSDWKYCNGYTVGNSDFIDNGKQYTTHLDEWEKNSLSRRDNNSNSALSRISLYRQFDPLLKSAQKPKMVNTASPEQTQNGFEWMNDTVIPPPRKKSYTNGTSDYQSNSNNYVRSPKPDVLAFATDSGCEEDILKEQIKCNEEKLKVKESYIEDLLSKLNDSEKKNASLEKLITTLNNVNNNLIQSISEVIDRKVNENNHLLEKFDALLREKSKTMDDINGVEKSFSDLHHRYDKLRHEFKLSKETESQSREKYLEAINQINRLEKCCHDLRKQIEEKSKSSAEKEKKEYESELIAVKAMCKKAEMKINALQLQLNQKCSENTELAAMVDELILQVKK